MSRTANLVLASLGCVLALAGCNKADPNSPAGKRHAAYEEMGDAMKALGEVLKENAPNLSNAAGPIATLKTQSAIVPTLFPAGSGPEGGQPTEALPAIWQRPAEFSAAMNRFTTAVAALDAAAKTGDVKTTRAAAANLGQTCKGCHDNFKKK